MFLLLSIIQNLKEKMSTSRYGPSRYRETQDMLDSLRRREDALDKWERDLRYREDCLQREMNRPHQINRTPNRKTNLPMKRPRVNKEKDYSKLAAPRETYVEDSDTMEDIKTELSF